MAAKTEPTAYLVAGSDDPSVRERAAVLAAELGKRAGADSEIEVFDAWVERAEEMAGAIRRAIGAILTPSLFASARVIWVKNATFLGDSTEGRSEVVAAAADELIAIIQQGLPDGVLFLLSSIVTDRRRTQTKQLEKLCRTEILESPTKSKDWEQHGAPELVEDLMQAQGLQWERGLPGEVVAICGQDPRTLRSEIQKLSIYAGESRKVTYADAKEILSSSPQASNWTWCDAVLLGRTDEALELLRILKFQDYSKNQAVPLMISLVGRAQLALRCRLLMDRKLLSISGSGGASWKDEAEEFLPKNKDGKPPHPFYIFSVCKIASARPLKEWLEVFDLLYSNYTGIFHKDGGYQHLENMILSLSVLGRGGDL